VAVGSYTKDGRVVIAHNNWTSYLDGARWTMVFDIVPAKGYHFIIDGLPALIHSGDDFGVNSAGIVITETTISGFHGFDTAGIPEFVRARKAMQYSASIDDVNRIFRDGGLSKCCTAFVLCWRLRSTTVTAWSLSSSIPSASTRLHCYILSGYGSSQVWTTLNYPGSRGETWRSGLSGHTFPRRVGTTIPTLKLATSAPGNQKSRPLYRATGIVE
jgi:hypothetical protein